MKRRLLVFLTAAVALAAASGLTWRYAVGADSSTELVPKTLIACEDCHSMEHEVVTWQQNPHQDVACLECHVEGDVSWIRHELAERNPEMEAGAGKPIHPVKLKAPEERCLDCHDAQLPYLMKDQTPPPIHGDTAAATEPLSVKALHDKHANGKADLSCLDCHTASAHGPLAGTDAYRDETHDRCQDCHEQKQVLLDAGSSSVSCAACHIDPSTVAPADHKDRSVWLDGHGQAKAVQQACGQCHLSDSAGPHGKLSSPTAFKTAAQDACQSCHAGVPMPHESNFLAKHGTMALQVKDGTCEACHSPASSPVQPTPEHARAGFCTDCHAQTMPHPANFLTQHGQAAWKAPATCDACHSSKNPARPTAAHASRSFCTSCHDAYEHGQGWVAKHGTQVDKSCSACHTTLPQQGGHNACSACHTANGQWHPDMFYVSHARVVETQGKDACMTCHSEIEPSCSKCHRNY